ncbi:hypothetical protein N0V93_007316 [Gnomoniopsis smithogilvyi]|uniref:CCHC-type domain-containing protein n=1 Tax=Gnomoniopsis smithogilvyi TaxID=1191159 RepID=A0A9W8YRK7_9PEZI|nr:hypothetical protein N0V93_007316 [Gnomoniopsis smithogilvyi]
MESILDDIDVGLLKQLNEESMRRMKLKHLDQLLEGQEHDVLKTYNFWLLARSIANSASGGDLESPPLSRSQLQSWCDRLQRNYGFEPKDIFDTLCDCTSDLIGSNAVNQLHLEKLQEDIRLLLFRPLGKKNRQRHQLLVADGKAPYTPRPPDGHSVKINDGKECGKTTMDTINTSVSDPQKPELINIPSQSVPEADVLNLYQGPHHHHLHPSTGPLYSEDPSPVERRFDSTMQNTYEMKHEPTSYDGPQFRSPHYMGASSHGTGTRHKSITDQPTNITLTQKDSCIKHDRIYDVGNAVGIMHKQIKIAQEKMVISRRQESEAPGEATDNLKNIGTDTYEKQMLSEKAEAIWGGSRASHLQRSNKSQEQIKKWEKPHNEYRCYRCEVPGHFVQDCPTNLDPSFDKIPVGSYRCMICGKIKAHLTSLCPDNTDPRSLTQLRLKFSATTSSQLQAQNDYRPGYGKKDQRQRGSMFDGLDNEMNEDRHHGIVELGIDDDDQLVNQDRFEFRYLRSKRAYSRQQSPQQYQNIDLYTLPPPKRVRHDDRKQDNSLEHGRGRHHQSRGENDAFSVDPSEPLTLLNRSRAHHGRLSFWDSEYQLPETPNPKISLSYRDAAFSSNPVPNKSQTLTQSLWPEDNRVEEIKNLFPSADKDWVENMAGFDVDKFFEEMDDLILSTGCEAQRSKSLC